MPVKPFPSGFHTENIKVDGAIIYGRVGGQGPAEVLLHDGGFLWRTPFSGRLLEKGVAAKLEALVS